MAKTISNPQVRFGGSIGGLMSQIDKLEGRLGALSNKSQGFAARFADIGAKLGMITVGIQAAAGMIGKAISVVTAPLADGFALANQLEQDQIAFETMLKSADAAAAHLDRLKTFAASTPFQLPGLITTSKQLLAFGFTSQEQIPLLTALGDVAAGTGSEVGDLGRIFGQVRAEGKLTSERFNQLMERGVPIGPALAKSMGVAETSLRELMGQGKISADVFRDAFESMASSEFGGLMEKQSKTIAGRLSTLQDNVGMAMAGIAGSLTKSLNLGGMIDGITNAIATVGPRVTAIVSNVASRVMGIVTGLVNWIRPYAAATWDWMASVFADRVRTVVGLAYSIWEAVKAVMGGIWQIVTSLWDATLGHWVGTMDELAGSTDSTMSTIGGAFVWLSDAAAWLAEKVTTGINAIAYTINNLGTLFDMVGTAIAHAVVKTANEIEYVFADVIPTVLTWFADNWRDVLYDVATFTATVFRNIGGNVVDIFSNLPGLISGATAWEDVWTPLTDGFETTVKELPDIAARVAGDVEQSLADQLDQQRREFREGFNEYVDQQAQKVDATIASLAPDAAEEQPPIDVKLPDFAIDEIPDVEVDATVEQPDVADAQASRAPSMASLLEAFSAEAMASRFGESVSLAVDPVAGDVADVMPDAPKDDDEQVKISQKLYDEAKAQTKALLNFGRSLFNRPQTIVTIG